MTPAIACGGRLGRIPDCSAIVVVCLILGAGVSVLRGQDANWDLRNYHLYIGWAALHDRLGIDLAAAGLQSWINPTLDIPYAWLALGPLAHYPRLLAAFMGLWYGALIAVMLGIAFELYGRWPVRRRWFAAGAAAILASTGAAVFSQAGTTFNEIQTSLLVMSSILLLVHELGRKEKSRAVILSFAGLFLGLATGMKITSAIYIPAAAMSLIAITPMRRWPTCLAPLLLGSIAGLALGGGWWAYKLYETYGNPVFPFFNGIFRSPWYPPVNRFDLRFLPRGIWQKLLYPFFWLSKEKMLVAEYGFRDGRIPIAYALIVITGVLALLGRVSKKKLFHRSIDRPQGFVLAFAMISYVLLLCTTSILRYAIPVEATATLSIPFLLAVVLRPELGSGHSRSWTACIATVSLLLLVFTRYPAWDRMPYGNRVVDADMNWVQPNSLVILLGSTVSYVVPFTDQRQAVQFVGLSDAVSEARGYGLTMEAINRVQSHRGPIVVIQGEHEKWRLPLLQDMGVVERPGSCRTFFGSYDVALGQQLHVCAGEAQISRNFAIRSGGLRRDGRRK